MKSFCRFLLVFVALFFGKSSAVKASDFGSNFGGDSGGDYFECDTELPIPNYLVDHCNMERGKTVNSYVASVVNQMFLTSHQNCNNDVDKVCRELPEVVKNYNAPGEAKCKEEMKEHLCDHAHNHQTKYGRKIYCSYLNTILEILIRQDSFVPGKEQEICSLFTPNDKLHAVLKTHQCKRLSNKLVRTYCHRTLKSGIRI